jgi:hypothetical protein
MKHKHSGRSSQCFDNDTGEETWSCDDFAVDEVRLQYEQCGVIGLDPGPTVGVLLNAS